MSSSATVTQISHMAISRVGCSWTPMRWLAVHGKRIVMVASSWGPEAIFTAWTQVTDGSRGVAARAPSVTGRLAAGPDAAPAAWPRWALLVVACKLASASFVEDGDGTCAVAVSPPAAVVVVGEASSVPNGFVEPGAFVAGPTSAPAGAACNESVPSLRVSAPTVVREVGAAGGAMGVPRQVTGLSRSSEPGGVVVAGGVEVVLGAVVGAPVVLGPLGGVSAVVVGAGSAVVVGAGGAVVAGWLVAGVVLPVHDAGMKPPSSSGSGAGVESAGGPAFALVVVPAGLVVLAVVAGRVVVEVVGGTVELVVGGSGVGVGSPGAADDDGGSLIVVEGAVVVDSPGTGVVDVSATDAARLRESAEPVVSASARCGVIPTAAHKVAPTTRITAVARARPRPPRSGVLMIGSLRGPRTRRAS